VKSRFARISLSEWCLDECLVKDRKDKLCHCISFEQIIARVAREAIVHNHMRNRACSHPQYFRALVTLKVGPSTVDLFHNSASGYRAQYYRSIDSGRCANWYALKNLLPRLKESLMGHEKRTCPWWWIEKSLLDPEAKLWIHQGRWLRYARSADRHLYVPRWVIQQNCQSKERRKKALWATLTPDSETCIELKGGYLTLEGKRLGKLKPARAKDIHELGFT
jgi:hypothetical protein